MSPRQQFSETRGEFRRGRGASRRGLLSSRRLAETGSPAQIFRSDVWWVDERCSMSTPTPPPTSTPVAEMKLHRRRAERDAGTTSSRARNMQIQSDRTRSPSSAKRFTEMSIFLFHARALILELGAFPHRPRPRLYDPVN